MKKKRFAAMALATAIASSTLFGAQIEASTYKVKSNDTLWKISMNKKVTVAQLKQWNKLKTDQIRVGQVLKVTPPTSASKLKQTNTNRPTYIVKSGDTLFLIAKKNKTTVSAIKTLNKLKSDKILVGQRLLLPNSVKGISSTNTPSYLAYASFPLPKGSFQPFGDTWGASRQYGGDRVHEGTDIMAPKGTPVYSATDGVIVSYGWNQLGGWRLSIRTNEGYNLYYAHLSKYAAGMKKGAVVKQGQVIGFVGNTGYGPAGTSGKFVSHLHFGMYDSNWKAINPYSHLKYWASK
ncbi:LysM peptidoglycan-binding domain-containing protein [Peribacillus glennii]|uniref:LysM peptidoglycan-binding domain-containing protein n=1 Tax=Peribacillus glennii TaxID=2303991 RepID=A0A372L7A8_9BACI|nr:M23 family metallopeptidase [Peribacillus glennii]RFU61126.1 LysM peptidoglycan-binding domain-containing protein [Peribacillus glennii]